MKIVEDECKSLRSQSQNTMGENQAADGLALRDDLDSGDDTSNISEFIRRRKESYAKIRELKENNNGEGEDGE